MTPALGWGLGAVLFAAMIVTLFFARSFALPVLLAFLFNLIFSPVVRFLKRRGIPEGLGAVVIGAGLLGGVFSGGYFLSGSMLEMTRSLPVALVQARLRLGNLYQPMESVAEATKQVEEMTEEEREVGVQEVVVKEPGFLRRAAEGAPELLVQVASFLVLTFFLLASGDMFYEKIVRVAPTLRDRKRALTIAFSVERQVSRYLFTIALINAALGVVVGAGLWLLEMPNPVLWGVAAAMLNFVPYIGALVGVVLIAIMALAHFPDISQAILIPIFYLACTMLEGQFITPWLVGRRLELNAVAVFLAVTFWGWLWGVVGALMAVPILVGVKALCDHIEGLHNLGEFLSARQPSNKGLEAENGK